MPGISMHYFPREEAVRQKWIRFVRKHRKDFVPYKSSTLWTVCYYAHITYKCMVSTILYGIQYCSKVTQGVYVRKSE